MDLNIKNIEIKNTKICECGYDFTIKDMTNLKRIQESGFYSNIVKHYSYTKCPKCQKDTILLLKQQGQTWGILNIATYKDTATKPQSQNEKENEEGEEFICQLCGKVCKSQIGLNSHLKTHQN